MGKTRKTYGVANWNSHVAGLEGQSSLSNLHDVDTWDRGSGGGLSGCYWSSGGGIRSVAVTLSHDGWDDREKSDELHIDGLIFFGLIKK